MAKSKWITIRLVKALIMAALLVLPLGCGGTKSVPSPSQSPSPSPDSPEEIPTVTSFNHPGILHTQTALERMKSKVAAKAAPWYGGYLKLSAHAQSSSGYSKQGPFATVVRDTVSSGINQLNNDCNAAYQNALMWYITGEPAYATKAIELLDAWSGTLTAITGHDADLAAALDGFKFANAAEILRYTASGWTAAGIAQCETMLKKVFYEVIKDFAQPMQPNGNWDAACIKSLMAIGVFCNDTQMFNNAVRYFYEGSGNGSLTNYIINPAGQCQESGRDQQHSQLGLAHLAEACEIGYSQGVDLYRARANRLLAGFEYTAEYNLGNAVPYVQHRDVFGKYSNWVVISTTNRGEFRPIYEMVYQHYVVRQGVSASYTGQVLNRIRPEGAAEWADHPGFGTLLFSL